jgi:hypothetical protein
MNKIKLGLILTLLSLFVGFSGAAQETTGPNGTNNLNRPTKTAEQRTERCAKANKKIDTKINRFNTNSDHPRLTKMIQRVTNIIAVLKAKNVNVTTLEADMATLKTKAEACKNAYGLFIAKLQTTKSFSCGTSQGQFKAALDAAKAEQTKVKAACQDAKKYVRTTIKKDLQTLKQQLRANRKLSVTPSPVTTTIEPTRQAETPTQ